MTTKEELKQQFEEAFDDTEKKEEAARALTTQGDAALITWGERETVIATGMRIKTILWPELSIPHALAGGQYAVATGLNPFRGEFYAFEDRKGDLHIVDGYKALTRWANDESPYDVQYREQELGPGEAYNEKAIIMRHDRRPQLDYYLEKGADFQTAFDLVTFSAVGVVMEKETKWPDGNPKDPPQGWTWKQVAQKRALKTALNMSHGMPTVAQLARQSWEVAGIITKPEDWEGTEDLKSDEQRELLAAAQARERERQEEWAVLTQEEKDEKVQDASTLLYGDGDEDGDIIEGEIVEDYKDLRLALGVGLPQKAPKMGLEEGAPLLDVVRRDGKDVIEYLTKSSSYKEPNEESLKVQEAAKTILAQWEQARSMAGDDEERKEVESEEIRVEEGGAVPLF